MNNRQKNHRIAQEKEMREIWESFKYLFKEKLVSMDNMCRSMIREMKTMSVPDDMISDFLPSEFNKLRDEVVAEQSIKRDREVKGA